MNRRPPLTSFLQEHGLADAKVFLLREGIENFNYLIVHGKRKYVLRLYRRKTHADVVKEVKILEYLAAAHVPVPKLVHLKKEKIAIIDSRPAVLFYHVHGSHPPWKPLGITLAGPVGRELARLHVALLGVHEDLDRESVPKSTAALPFTSKTELINTMKIIALSDLPEGYVHGDLTRENMLVHRNKLAAFLDFDDFHKDYLVWDVAVAGTQLFVTKTYGIDYQGFGSFLKGYSAVRSLAPDEKRALIPFMELQNIRLAYFVRQASFHRTKKKLASIASSIKEKRKLILHHREELQSVIDRSA